MSGWLERTSKTKLEMLNLVKDFLERKGLWEGEYPIDNSNLNMNLWQLVNHHTCGTVGCAVGHMAKDPIWNAMGLKFKCNCGISNHLEPWYNDLYGFYAIIALFKLTPAEAHYIFYIPSYGVINITKEDVLTHINSVINNDVQFQNYCKSYKPL